MTQEKVESRIERFVRKQFTIAPTDAAFNRSALLFERGYVDSVGVVELLAFLEEEFGVEIPDDELMSEEFSTIEGIAGIVRALVERRAATTVSPSAEGAAL